MLQVDKLHLEYGCRHTMFDCNKKKINLLLEYESKIYLKCLFDRLGKLLFGITLSLNT